MHAVVRVEKLIHYIRTNCSWPSRFVVVDNGPDATDNMWSDGIDTLLIENRYLGSEQAFMEGLRAAGDAERYLLLDHDASISDESLATLLDYGAQKPASVICASHGYNHAGWRIGEVRPGSDGPGGLVPLQASQWSGYLLNRQARDMLLSRRPSGFFFYWDDWLATWFLRSQGVEVLGTAAAVVWNHRTDLDSPWKMYYEVRNGLLYARDTGQPFGARWEAYVRSGRRALGQARRRNWKLFAAASRGFRDGLVGRRGMVLTPAPN
jgi:GT2 family glycosyltransferase